MSIEEQMKIQRANDAMQRIHTFVSVVGNALERIGILIDEDDPDEAKREIDELREALGKMYG